MGSGLPAIWLAAAQRIRHPRSSGRAAIARPLAASAIFLCPGAGRFLLGRGRDANRFASHLKRPEANSRGHTLPACAEGPGPPKLDDYCPERLSKRCVDLSFYGVLA